MSTGERWVVVGGGILGTVAALSGAQAGHQVVLVESGSSLGGLTATQQIPTPSGPVGCDRFYHVILESDRRLLALLRQLGLADSVLWSRVPAVVVASGQQHPASSLVEMATLPALRPVDRLRTGLSVLVSLALPRAVADRTTALAWLHRVAGRQATESFWKPILRAKLGTMAEQVTATFVVSTFRRLVLARLSGAGDRFGVLPGGYGPVFAALRARLLAAGVTVVDSCAVTDVRRTIAHPPSANGRPPTTDSPGRLTVGLADGRQLHAERVIITTPGPVTARIAPDLTPRETHRLTGSPYLGVVCAALLLADPPNPAYITYLVDDVGLTGVVGMHALLNPSHTGGYHLVYLPRYCAPDDPWFDEPDEVLLERLLAAARACLPEVSLEVAGAAVSKARHVVPLPTPEAPPALPFSTSVPGLHVVSAAQNTSGTLNVEGTLEMAADALHRILREART